MPMPLKEFQNIICDGIVAQFGEVRELYRQIAAAAPERIDEARRKDAAIVLQAPTGAGKTPDGDRGDAPCVSRGAGIVVLVRAFRWVSRAIAPSLEQ